MPAADPAFAMPDISSEPAEYSFAEYWHYFYSLRASSFHRPDQESMVALAPAESPGKLMNPLPSGDKLDQGRPHLVMVLVSGWPILCARPRQAELPAGIQPQP